MKDNNIVRLTLMNRTHPVCDLEYDNRFHCIRRILHFYDDGFYAPLGLTGNDREHIDDLYSDWWGKRSIPRERADVEDLLKQYGFNSARELAMQSHGLSLSDQYWMRGLGEDISWEAVNYFRNPFSDALGRALMHHAHHARLELGPDVLRDPSGTSEGVLPKRWTIIDRVRTLIKGSRHLGQEPYNEVIATFLHEQLLAPGEYVYYRLHEEEGKIYSACATMLTDEEEYVPAIYVRNIRERSDECTELEHYLSCCEDLGVTDARRGIDKMIICDYLLANSDRHYRNFGVIRNVETHKCRIAPLFDSGLSLWCNEASLGNRPVPWKSKPFNQQPEAQLQLARDRSMVSAAKLDAVQRFLAETMSAGPFQDDPLRVVFIEEGFRRNAETVLTAGSRCG